MKPWWLKMAKRLSLYLRQEELDRLTYIEQTLKIKYKGYWNMVPDKMKL